MKVLYYYIVKIHRGPIDSLRTKMTLEILLATFYLHIRWPPYKAVVKISNKKNNNKNTRRKIYAFYDRINQFLEHWIQPLDGARWTQYLMAEDFHIIIL